MISDDAALTQARLWLAEACRIGLADALGDPRRARARRDAPPRRRRRGLTGTHGGRVRGAVRPVARAGGSARARPRGARGASTARRSSSTTRTTCGAGAASTSRTSGRQRRVRGQGVPLHRDGPARRRGGPPARRRDRRRAPRRAAAPGFPPARIVFHGNNKRDAEIDAALDAGVGRIVADSFDELDRLERLAADARSGRSRWTCSSASRRASRRTPTSSSRPAPSGRSSASRSRTASRSRRRAAGRRGARSCASAGCTATSARRSTGSIPTRGRSRSSSRWPPRSRATTGEPIDELNFGGGLGARYLADDPVVEVADYAKTLHGALRAGRGRRRSRAGPAAQRRARPLDRGPGGHHALPGRHGQGDPRRRHLRRGRRRA